MKKIRLTSALILAINFLSMAQNVMTPEKLWEVKRLSVLGVSEDNATVFYKLSIPKIEENSFDSKYYKLPVSGGDAVEIEKEQVQTSDKNLSPDGSLKLFHKKVHLENVLSTDTYKNLPKSNAYVFSELDNRHWDSWSDGSYEHVFYKTATPFWR